MVAGLVSCGGFCFSGEAFLDSFIFAACSAFSTCSCGLNDTEFIDSSKELVSALYPGLSTILEFFSFSSAGGKTL